MNSSLNPLEVPELLEHILKENYKETVFVNHRFSSATIDANRRKVETSFNAYMQNPSFGLKHKTDALARLKDILIYTNLCSSRPEESLLEKRKKLAVLTAQLAEVMLFLSTDNFIKFTLFRKFVPVSIEYHVSVFLEYEQKEQRTPIDERDLITYKNEFSNDSTSTGNGNQEFHGTGPIIAALTDSIRLAKENSFSVFSYFWKNKLKYEFFKLLLACVKSLEKTALEYSLIPETLPSIDSFRT